MSDIPKQAESVATGFYQMMTTVVSFKRPHIMTKEAQQGFDWLTDNGYLEKLDTMLGDGSVAIAWHKTYKMKDFPFISRAKMQKDKDYQFKITTE